MFRFAVIAFLLIALFASASLDERSSLIDERRILPAEHEAIDYWNAKPSGAVARLQERLSSGEAQLEYDDRFGYLPAVLKALEIPVSSQVLVFSKTSFQASKIFPRVPRAIYHNDHAAVGWVRGGDVLEVLALDPRMGVVFYTLGQEQIGSPYFQARTIECISCHVGSFTLGVPGLMVRSIPVDRSGMPLRAPSFITDHRSPFSERWGGWYVSGLHGSQPHMGNVTFSPGGARTPLTGESAANLPDLAPYISPVEYLRTKSDIVSLMVLEHQTRMTNLIVRLGYETRIALHGNPDEVSLSGVPDRARGDIENTAEELLRYMLFTREAQIEEPIRGDAEFVKDFEAAGHFDTRGRSLRKLDLNQRLLRYPCSYLIYSEAFEGLPLVAKELVYRRLWEVLTGKDNSASFSSLKAKDRRAILEILRDTKSDLPSYWSDGSSQAPA